jgi:hypothetical protein
MRHRIRHKRQAPFTFLLVALLASVGIINAAPDALEIAWWTVDGGGGPLDTNGYSLSGTVGQPDAGAVLAQDVFTLVGGYWYGAGPEEEWHELFLPVVLSAG